MLQVTSRWFHLSRPHFFFLSHKISFSSCQQGTEFFRAWPAQTCTGFISRIKHLISIQAQTYNLVFRTEYLKMRTLLRCYLLFLDKTTASLSIKSSLMIFFLLGKAHNYLFLSTSCCTRNFFPPPSSRQNLKAAKTMLWLKNSLEERIHSKQNQPVFLEILSGSGRREGMSSVLSLPLNLALTWTLWAGVAQRVWRDKIGDVCSKRPEIFLGLLQKDTLEACGEKSEKQQIFLGKINTISCLKKNAKPRCEWQQ